MGPVTRPCGPCTLLGRVRGLPEPPRASCLGGGRTHPWWRGVNLLQLRRAESSGSWDLEWKRWILGLSMPLPPLLGDRSPCSSPHLPSPPLEAQPELLPACVPQSAGHPCPQLPPLADHLQAQPWPAGAWQGPQQARDGGANGWRSPPLLPGIGGPRGPGGDSGPGHTASGSQGPRAMEVALALSTPVTRIRARSRVGAAQKGVPGDRTQDSHQGCRGPVLAPPSGLPECFTSSRGGSSLGPGAGLGTGALQSGHCLPVPEGLAQTWSPSPLAPSEPGSGGGGGERGSRGERNHLSPHTPQAWGDPQLTSWWQRHRGPQR